MPYMLFDGHWDDKCKRNIVYFMLHCMWCIIQSSKRGHLLLCRDKVVPVCAVKAYEGVEVG